MTDRNLQKLTRLSHWLRYLAIGIFMIGLAQLIYYVLLTDHAPKIDPPEFEMLWMSGAASKSWLMLFFAPSLLWGIAFFYWLQKLLGYFAKGVFFAASNMRCYLWLVWIKATGVAMQIAQSIAIQTYYNRLFDSSELEINIDFEQIMTILVMLLIAYLLKAAAELERENQSFV